MGRGLFLIALALTVGCREEAPTSGATAAKSRGARAARRPEMDDFFVKWLKAHGHADVVVDAAGVGVAGNATRLRASLYGSKRHADGGFVVEVEFTVRLPSGREITEFVAGMGDAEEKAINDALLNFTLTTFHVVYKGFINPADPHTTMTKVAVGGVDRDVIAGDIFMRGTASGTDVDLNAMRSEIQGVLKDVPLAPGPHWIKVVYSQNDGKPMTVAVTLDNADHLGMTRAVERLKWPRRDGFYMAKQFIVVK
jgi:hypothetical protein